MMGFWFFGLLLFGSLRDFAISVDRSITNNQRYTANRPNNMRSTSQHLKKEVSEFCKGAHECVINDCRGNRCGGRVEGQWCKKNNWCSDGNCYKGACHKENAYKDIGETCLHRRECLSTRCNEGKCVGRINGEWCQKKEWCASEHCYKSICAEKLVDPCTLDATKVTCLGDCAWSNGECSYSENHVWCGAHQAPSCDLCPSGHGDSWCEGNCAWFNGSCILVSDLLDPCVANNDVKTCIGVCAWSNGACSFSETHVNCGGHQAPSCSLCLSGHGESWCGGECDWNNGSCNKEPLPFEATQGNIKDAVALWVSDNSKALFEYGPIGKWDTSRVTDMAFLFYTKTTFNDNISGWNTSSVTKMQHMFNRARKFNVNIVSWKTDKVTDMCGVFYHADVFDQNIASWKTDKVVDMNYMFSSTHAFNQNVASWTTDKVTDMHNMFIGTRAFNQNISSWKTDKVKSMHAMFAHAQAFNQNMCKWLYNSSFPYNIDTNDMFLFSKCDIKNDPSSSFVCQIC